LTTVGGKLRFLALSIKRTVICHLTINLEKILAARKTNVAPADVIGRLQISNSRGVSS